MLFLIGALFFIGTLNLHGATNHAPVSHAGDDLSVEGGAGVTLDGTYSWDADANPLTYIWTQTEDPAVTLNLSDPA